MPCLLVVDDEPGVRESLRMLFRDDCEVATADSVEEAERFLHGSSPDLILLDLVMPYPSEWNLYSFAGVNLVAENAWGFQSRRSRSLSG